MHDDEVRTLIHQAEAGDRDALQKLLVQFHAALRARVAAALAPAAARRLEPEDVLQLAYITAFQRLRGCTFEGPRAFYGWLEQIALNVARSQQRDQWRQKRDIAREIHASSGLDLRPSDASPSYADLLHRVAGGEDTPSRSLCRSEAAAAVLAALARLTEDQRTVIRLRFLEGRSVPDVARHLDRSEEAIHALCYRAMKELRATLGSITRYLTRG